MKKIGVLFLIFSFVLLPVSPAGIFFQLTHADDEEEYDCKDYDLWYCDEDEYVVIDEDTVWSGNVSYSDEKINIVNEATLTIEKGAHIEVQKISVFDGGKIIANGTEEEKIIFTKHQFDPSTIPPEYSEYDPQCFNNSVGTIEFSGWSWEEAEVSSFKYVEFDNMGSRVQVDSDDCIPIAMNNHKKHSTIFNTVYAEERTSVEPAIMFRSGRVEIQNSTFKNNSYADIEVEMTVDSDYEIYDYFHVTNSNFENNLQNTALISDIADFDGSEHDNSNLILMKNNWYGDASGPEFEGNPDGKGEKLAGEVLVDGWSNMKFENNALEPSNVMFLPGIKASHLYKKDSSGDEDELWIPNFFGDDIDELALDDDGKSVNDVYTKDIIEEDPAGNNIYETFVEKLESLKNDGTINDFNLFAYDWRQDVEDIAENGTPYPDDEIKSAIATLSSLAGSSKSKKVTIIAHSNGGLLAKAIMLELEKRGLSDKVDKIIFVGSPQMGTPLPILSMLYGHDETLAFGTLLSQSEARTFVENMPGAYGLFPSKEYFDRMENSLINFSSKNTRYKNFIDVYGDEISNEDEFRSFLLGKDDEREKPESDEVEIENVLNENLFDQAAEMHEELDAWTPPENIKVIQIAGWGLDTVSGIDYTEKEDVKCYASPGGKVPSCTGIGEYKPIYKPKLTVDGDAVVVAPSALMLSEDDNIEKYWVDLYENNKGLNINRDHASIFEVDSLQQFILNAIKNIDQSSSLPEHILTSRPDPENYDDAKPRIRMELYSPLDIHLHDDKGNHTGPKNIEIDGGTKTIFEKKIPNSFYYQFGNQKYVGVPKGEHIQMTMDGYAEGTYTLKMEEVEITETEETIFQTTFKNLPVSASTSVLLNIPESGLENLSDLAEDFDGDGTNDFTITSVENGETTLIDSAAPQTEAEILGTEEKNDWYTSDVEIKFSGSDDLFGIDKTYHSLDGLPYETGDSMFISDEGKHKIKYYSVDFAGNIEKEKEVEIKIDKTNPEIKIIFPENKKYLNDEKIYFDYEILDEQSEIAQKSIFWDAKAYAKNNVDLSLISLGGHAFKIEAENLAGEKSEKQVALDVATSPKAIRENVENYFKLGLIRNENKKNLLAVGISVIEQNLQLLEIIKNSPFFDQKTKGFLTQIIKKATNSQINLIIYQINRDSKMYDISIKNILIECLNFVRI